MKKKKTIPSFPIVGIGGSAGGLEAFRELLRNLPVKTGMAYVFIMHLLHDHKSMLPELLAEMTKMPVSRVKNGMRLEANHVYVITPDMVISVEAGKLVLKNINKTGLPHLPVDHFFNSLAREIGPKAIGVILSGTATDGTLGAGRIKAEGGITFAQDDRSAKFDGMPQSAIASGFIDFVLSPKKIAEKLADIAKNPVLSQAEPFKIDKDSVTEKDFEEVFNILHSAKGLDFTHYKDATITRRVQRRMVLLKLTKLKSYVKFLLKNGDEVERLYEDLLINVTGFFRDPEVFETLKKLALPAILKKKEKGQSIRLWVPGCSSGEDVYSVAMCLFEVMENQTRTVPVQIFATDVSETSINKARSGYYDKNIKDHIKPERLKRFFTKEGDFYKVSKQLREMCVFSRQNVFNDPPFSNIDLIICRNLLIYLKPVLQKKVFHNFHYSLIPGGFLLLGSSESVGGYSGFFNTLDRKHKIFVKKYLHGRLEPAFNKKYCQPKKMEIKDKINIQKSKELDAETIVEQVILNELVPSGVLIDSNMEIVQFHGSTGRYLESAAGKPSLDIFKLAREGLLFPLRAAIYKAKALKHMFKREAANVKSDGRRRQVNITVVPVRSESLKGEHFLVLFEEAGMAAAEKSLVKARGKSFKDEKYMETMQKELSETKEYLQTVIEGLDSSNEELKTANEEILSSNEELQSANEELETSKEELQSANEELITANEELNNRNTEVSFLNNDLVNLLSSINMPVIMMDTGFVIRRMTSQVEKALNLTSSDIGRPINKIKLDLDIPDLEKLLLDVIESLRPKVLEVKGQNGNWYSVYIRPYRTTDNKIDGVVMIFVDITEQRKLEKEIISLAKFPSENPNPVLRISEGGTVLYSNERGMKLLAKWNTKVGGKAAERWCRLIRENFVSGKAYMAEEEEVNGVIFSVIVSVVKEAGYVNLYCMDITMRKRAEERLQLSRDILNLLNGPLDEFDAIRGIMELIRENTGFDAVGIRLQEGEDFPYYETSGFSEVFTRKERFLCQRDKNGNIVRDKKGIPVLECICGKIIRGRIDAKQPFFTEGGSFWTNSTTKLITETSEEDWETNLRNRCNAAGYESMALIPLRFGADRIGLFQFNDRRLNMFTPDLIKYLEGLSASIGIALSRKRAEENLRASEELYRTLIENIDLSMCIIDKDYKLIMANSGFCEMFGLNKDEIKGLPCFEVYNKRSSVCPDCPGRKVIASKKAVKVEAKRARADGTRFPVNISTYPVYDSNNNVKYFIKIIEDLSELKKIEQAKKNMIRDISHSLKTPIAMTEMAFGIAKNSMNSGDKEGMAKAERIASENLKKLRKDVTNILLEFSIDVHKDIIDKSKEAPLKAAVVKSANELKSLMDEKGLQLEINLAQNTDKVKIDGRDLDIILNNLLDNAVKFTEKGKISVAGRLNGEFVEIEVKDTGCGISAQDINRVFEKFYKRHASIDGTGLGLSICKELVEMYDGEIKIFSEGVGKGTTVLLSLPQA